MIALRLIQRGQRAAAVGAAAVSSLRTFPAHYTYAFVQLSCSSHQPSRTMTSAAPADAKVSAINHDAPSKRFSATVGEGGEQCELLYLLEDAGGRKVMNITRTYTAPSARGKGVAGKLADAAFTFAREHGYAVRPTCSYIADAYIPGGKGAAASFAMDAGSGLALPKSA